MRDLNLNGIMPPLTTPFDDSGGVDYEGLAQNVERYNQIALTGYVVLGSNGEAVHLSRDEQAKTVELVKSAAQKAPGASRTVIAGVNELSTRAAIESVRRAADAGADAVLVITPYYYKSAMSQEALFRHFTGVADSSSIPVLVYNVPQFTGVAIEPATIASLAEHPKIVGVKDSAGNINALSETIALGPAGFAVLTGHAGILYPALMLGATGAIVAVACLAPGSCVSLFDAVRAGNQAQARELHNRIAPLSHLVTAVLGVPGLKAAMELAVYRGGVARAPLMRVSDADVDKLRAVMRSSGLFPELNET